MRKITYILLAVAILLATGTWNANAQKKLKIGKTEIILQSPMKIQETKPLVDTNDVTITIETVKSEDGNVKQTTKKTYRHINHSFTDFYFGMGLSTMAGLNGEKYYPTVQYGKAFDLQTGLKFFFRPVRWYAIGTQFQYSFYSYRMDGAAQAGFIGEPMPENIRSEYFKTDNVGTAWLNRFYIYRDFHIELGVYGDYSFSKRYVVKTDNEKFKYRDCNRFTPLQAGVQASICIDWFSIYAKYRITDMFNHEILPLDPPRLNIGAMLTF